MFSLYNTALRLRRLSRGRPRGPDYVLGARLRAGGLAEALGVELLPFLLLLHGELLVLV